ncbi:MAG: ABC transporter permease subunit [Gemmatimonadetes bacterium]|jgi:ABC-2 type transport system permease protein|nr:ABC transporter permease subunit [Gemmatimonadota bacterium]MBT7863488.1 ABC transporter permease subunit [Gemmatimonadota bacterium]
MPETPGRQTEGSDVSVSDALGRNALGWIDACRLVAGRELRAYFDSPIAYIYAAVFLVSSGSAFMNAFFLEAVLDMASWFERLPYLLIFFAPAMTMRSWAEEHAQGTVEILLTLPLRSAQIVVGKFIAALLFYGIVIAGSLPILVMLLRLGPADVGMILTGYVGAMCLGAFFLAFGQFVSSLTHNQIVAFVLAALLACLFIFSGHPQVVEIIDGLAPGWEPGSWLAASLSVVPHYESFVAGIIGVGPLLYFASMVALFLWLTEIGLRRVRL